MNHRIVRAVSIIDGEDDETYLEIHETYSGGMGYDGDDLIITEHTGPITMIVEEEDGIEELRKMLTSMLSALDKPILDSSEVIGTSRF